MLKPSLRSARAISGAAVLAIAVAIAGHATMTFAQQRGAAAQSAPIARGQKIVMATHSFNVFIGPSGAASARSPGPLAALAAERGKAGHETLAVQMIGGSTPMQHWSQGNGDESKNIAKVALKTGGPSVDVFTMSPNAKMPEEGIDLFGDYVRATNPNARILVQQSWNSYDGRGNTPSVGGGGVDPTFNNAERDKITVADIDKWLAGDEPGMRGKDYLGRLRAQLAGVDRRAGKEITYVVPSGNAVYGLRKAVLAGQVPGVAKQSELFRDSIGHSTQPTSNVVTYTWYAVMYRDNPVGLQALVDKADPNSAAREKILQQIAWNAAVSEPKSGVRGSPVRVGS